MSILKKIVARRRTTVKAPSGIADAYVEPSALVPLAKKNKAQIQTCWTYRPTNVCWMALGKNKPPVSPEADGFFLKIALY